MLEYVAFIFTIVLLIITVIITVFLYSQIQTSIDRLINLPDLPTCPSDSSSTAFFMGDGKIAFSTG